MAFCVTFVVQIAFATFESRAISASRRSFSHRFSPFCHTHMTEDHGTIILFSMERTPKVWLVCGRTIITFVCSQSSQPNRVNCNQACRMSKVFSVSWSTIVSWRGRFHSSLRHGSKTSFFERPSSQIERTARKTVMIWKALRFHSKSKHAYLWRFASLHKRKHLRSVYHSIPKCSSQSHYMFKEAHRQLKQWQ